MRTVILLRHGRSTSNAAGTLAGRGDGVDLDETGRGQAERLPGGSPGCASTGWSAPRWTAAGKPSRRWPTPVAWR